MLICVEFHMRKIQNVTLCKNELLQRQTFLMNKSVIFAVFFGKILTKVLEEISE
jgi:hypothetical protein